MTPFVWTDVRDRAVRHFGHGPSNQVEAELLALWSKSPERVSTVLDAVVADLGNIRNPWAVFLHRVHLALDKPRGNPTAPPSVDEAAERRRAAIARTKQWIENTGWMYPFDDFDDELFGRRGFLSRYRDDTALRAEMRELWEKTRNDRGAADSDPQWPESTRFKPPEGERGGQQTLDVGKAKS